MNINSSELDKFKEDFEVAMVSLQEKYDVTITLGPITYYKNDFSASLTVDNGRDPEEIRCRRFNRNVWKYKSLGFEEGMYRRIFIADDEKRYAILGFNTKAKKYPLVIADIETGESFKATTGFVRQIVNEFYIEAVTVNDDDFVD